MFGILRSGFVALGFLAAGTAQAVILDVTYDGRLKTFNDGVGNFGGLVIDGDDPPSVTARFRFDTSLGVRTTQSGIFERDRIVGESNQLTGVPVLSASITVGTVTYALRSPFREGQINGEGGPNPFVLPLQFRVPEQLSHLARFTNQLPGSFEQDFLAARIQGLREVFFDPHLSLIEAERSHAAIPGEIFGEIQFGSFIVGPVSARTDVTAALTGMSVVVVTAGVPEPSTWAMMLVGFAGLAHAARRRREAAAAAA